MTPQKIEGAMSIGKPHDWTDNDCRALDCIPVEHPLEGGRKQKGLRSRWLPSARELELLNQGQPVSLDVLAGGVMVPVSVFVEEPELKTGGPYFPTIKVEELPDEATAN